MSACIHACMYVCMHACMHACMCMCMCMYMFIRKCIISYNSVYICNIHVYTYTVYVYVYAHVNVHVHVTCICIICICRFICIWYAAMTMKGTSQGWSDQPVDSGKGWTGQNLLLDDYDLQHLVTFIQSYKRETHPAVWLESEIWPEIESEIWK